MHRWQMADSASINSGYDTTSFFRNRGLEKNQFISYYGGLISFKITFYIFYFIKKYLLYKHKFNVNII